MIPAVVIAGSIATIAYLMGRMSKDTSGPRVGNCDGANEYEGMDEETYGEAEHRNNNSITMSDPMYSLVESGAKTIEVRVGGPNKFQDIVGKTLAFYNPVLRESITVEVQKVVHYPDLETLTKNEDAGKILGGKNKKASDVIDTYLPYCKPEIVDRVGGVVAMHIKFARRGK
jgi:ASC-1-like (ASCH) protein